MKKYKTIKMTIEEAKHLEKWIQNSLTLAKALRPGDENNEWLEKMLKIIKKEEDEIPFA